MQIRETTMTPLPDGKTLVDVICSDQTDPDQANNYLHVRSVQDARGRTAMAAIQRAALENAFLWIQEECERLRTQYG